jgi:Carboxypeptidase regulatory-like domain
MSSRYGSRLYSASLQQSITLAAISCLLSGAAIGQVLYGSLTGNVSDPSGASVVGAKVTAVNVATGLNAETTVNESGVYRFQALHAGTYKVSISAPNFATQVTGNVQHHRKHRTGLW